MGIWPLSLKREHVESASTCAFAASGKNIRIVHTFVKRSKERPSGCVESGGLFASVLRLSCNACINAQVVSWT